MGRGLTHLKTPVKQVPGMSVKLSGSCPSASRQRGCGMWGGEAMGVFSGCEASGQSQACWPLGRLAVDPTIQLRLAVAGEWAGGFFMEPPGRSQEIPGFQFRAGSSGFHGAFSLPPSPVKECCGWCSVLFWF